MKLCPRCRETLPLEQFRKNRSARDGLQSRCRVCQIAANKEYRHRHPERTRAAQRYHASRRPRPEHRETQQQKTAHNKVLKATRLGLLVRPDSCSTCGATDSPIHGHHDDYSKPLDVRWLCARCHGELHFGTRATPPEGA